MDKLLHALAVMATVLAAVVGAVPAGAAPLPLGGNDLNAGPLVAYGGTVAWWTGRAGDHTATLNVWRPGETAPRRVELQASGWDLDLGPGPDGATWAVYSRCASGGCRPYGYDLGTGAIRGLGVGRGTHPAIWRDRVALWRHHRILVAHVDHTAPTHAVAAGIEDGHLDAIDLRGHRIAYIYDEGGDSRSIDMVARELGAGNDLQTGGQGGYGEEGGDFLFSPTLTPSGVTWLEASSGGDEHGRTSLHRSDAGGSDHRTRIAQAEAAVGAVVTAGRLVIMAPPPGFADPAVAEPCYLDESLRLMARHGCRVTARPLG
jgi:hypothetical protein